jgi:hypothetical protein
MVKITDEMKKAYFAAGDSAETVAALAPLIIAQYEAEKAAAAAPVPFEITSMDQKVQFRNGTPAWLLAVDLPGTTPIVAYDPRSGAIIRKRVDGSSPYASNCDNDLIPIPPAERFAYVNVYPTEAFSLYATRTEADMRSFPNRTGCNRIVLKEGVWDD